MHKGYNYTEAMLLEKINMGKISLAEVARQANISMQAMHKCAKKLEDEIAQIIGYENIKIIKSMLEKQWVK